MPQIAFENFEPARDDAGNELPVPRELKLTPIPVRRKTLRAFKLPETAQIVDPSGRNGRGRGLAGHYVVEEEDGEITIMTEARFRSEFVDASSPPPEGFGSAPKPPPEKP